MNALEELEFCLKLWKEKGGCEFGGQKSCEGCGAPYVLWKLASREVLHGKDQKNLTLKEWKQKLGGYQKK
ncbi:MAG: hypothetical protein GOU97_04640 [Nanoarchaeota archaeon]|nr:hypothetical protein [Nanoarchaeota archaeon]